MVRTVTIQVRWVALALVLVAVALLVLAVRRPVAPAPPAIDPARIRAACQQYAGLDLSGWAAICRDAGYQERAAYNQPTGDPPYWPRVVRTVDGTAGVVQPEDLDRP